MTKTEVNELGNKGIYFITNFPGFEIEIDFNNHEIAQTKIAEQIQKLEEHSPFGKVFGKEDNILEGYVFEFEFMNSIHFWKSKGDKHSKSKVKTQKTYTPEELEKLSDAKKCSEEIFSHQRCNQALTELFGPNDEDVDIKRMGEYLKWISQDTLKEESDIIVGYKLEPKDVMKYVQDKAKKYFLGIIK